MVLRRVLMIVLSLALVGAVSACGNKQAKNLTAETEGPYVDLGDLKYQVQISRQLNPASVEDRNYLIGLNANDRRLPVGQEWFAVFVRVENDGDKPARAATDYLITDTQGNRYRPLGFAPVNVFAYRGGGVMQPTEILPKPDSPSGQGSIQGALLLFKIPTRNLENRPLELSIRTPAAPGKVATVDLDV